MNILSKHEEERRNQLEMEQILSNEKETKTIIESPNGETNELNVNPLNALQDSWCSHADRRDDVYEHPFFIICFNSIRKFRVMMIKNTLLPTKPTTNRSNITSKPSKMDPQSNK
ncbi:hypothetical protein [Bacillus sp. Bos-x628]|uniref:hypothetical protein n=1 Tax=Bacillus maqinnsis TaxID=3229854 RepID=UPI00338D4CB2